ncbi:hypothetical protein [Caulobacter vibrioides]|nr:hypothetical protein [Caulobacter vibrioides]YP_002518068.2 hypothetical protein CCNA_02695 [Caulobacter vibrioides NA1000]ACL96160.2 hypothetical protein CCNA_02695 [Caulobacter vibrioides NA1000]QBQ57299.1 hypothetical protein EUX21_02890 [synthetic Caulobacter sp. 'ethensis']QXZ50975.1 hypothetical protein KZH45_13870 [Caulobacter vibrioides]
MALDAETTAFLALDDFEMAAWAPRRATERGVEPPAPALPGVIDNLVLLRSQTALFVAALGEAADEAPETFQP